MKYLELSDLKNDTKVTAILFNKGLYVTLDDNQGWQILDKVVELWQKFPDGRLLRVRKWLKKSVLNFYTE